ncbi:ROK family transcriptional regulator [Fervidobacterium thailandense]|nr:ROK family transcriptional regulator [Fervidobacterium thailandense]
MKKILHSEMKENNYTLILRSIFHNKRIERVNLAKETGLSPSTVTRCVSKLVEKGYILETGFSEGLSSGRKPISLEINPDAIRVLLVDVGARITNFALGKANGLIEKLESIATPITFEELLREVYYLLDCFRNIDIIAFSIPGMVDVNSNKIIFVPSRGWRNLEVSIRGVEVFLDNEANLAIIAEAFSHEEIRKSQCSVFVTVREGFGTGLWINGRIYRGPSYTAGEFGHTTIDVKSTKTCHCGNNGCIEEYTSVTSFFNTYGEHLRREINSLLQMRDKKIDEYLEILARAVANIVNALNPEYVIVGGELAGLKDEFYEELERRVKKYSLFPAAHILKVKPATFKTDTYLYGALYAVIQEVFIPRVIESIS